jgi:polysaccharide chain length determinant protein (PEP-CTERM system associated)
VIPGKRYTAETLLKIAWRRKWLIVVPSVVIALASLAWIHFLPNVYRANTLILVVPQRVPESYVRATVTTRIEDRLQSISQQILSRTRLEKIVQDFNLYPERRSSEVMEDIVERMRSKDITIDIVKGDAFRVSYSSPQPLTAMKVTERLASLFIDESLRDREALAEGTNQFLEAQLDEARRKLVENEKTLAEYQNKYNGELPTQLNANLQGLHNTEMQLQALVESTNRDRDRRLLVERLTADANLDASGDAAQTKAPSSGDDATLSPTEQLRAAETALVALELRLKAEHPDVIRLKRNITDLKKRIAAEAVDQPVSTSGKVVMGPGDIVRRNRMNEAKAELSSLDLQLASKANEESRLRGVLGEYQKRIEATPAREAELAGLTRDYDTIQQSYRTLLTKKEESQIAANLERRQIGEQFRVVDAARVPEKPASPDRPKLYLLALTSALVIGCAFAASAEFLDRTMRSAEDVRAALNLMVLATIPTLTGRRARWWRRSR